MNNLSLYEVKHYVRKAQNAVLNLSEIETKVREATNNEPWGASSSLMAEIARGTFNYRDREEICNMIFRRYTEKSAHEWRQIYKALQLEEYLVKHGSERFVDDARANVNLISMLKSFHYIDSKGVDQGINVRNRAREVAALLNDEAKIRQERKKAKDNSKKFGAVSSSAYIGGSDSRTSSFNGGSVGAAHVTVDADGYENRVFGDGGVYGSRYGDTAASRGPVSSSRKTTYEEYQLETESSRAAKPTVATSTSTSGNLVSFMDDDSGAPDTATSGAATTTAAAAPDDDDDFDDFQSAPATTTQPSAQTNLADLLSASYAHPQQTQTSSAFGNFSTAPSTTAAPITGSIASKPKPQADLFGSLLVSAKTSAKPSSRSTSSTKPSYQTTTMASTTTTSTSAAPTGDLLDF